MTAEEECIHGMEFGCTICSGKDRITPEREPEPFVSDLIVAVCHKCKDPLFGMWIVRVDNHLLHEDCQ